MVSVEELIERARKGDKEAIRFLEKEGIDYKDKKPPAEFIEKWTTTYAESKPFNKIIHERELAILKADLRECPEPEPVNLKDKNKKPKKDIYLFLKKVEIYRSIDETGGEESFVGDNIKFQMRQECSRALSKVYLKHYGRKCQYIAVFRANQRKYYITLIKKKEIDTWLDMSREEILSKMKIKKRDLIMRVPNEFKASSE